MILSYICTQQYCKILMPCIFSFVDMTHRNPLLWPELNLCTMSAHRFVFIFYTVVKDKARQSFIIKYFMESFSDLFMITNTSYNICPNRS